MNQPPNFDLARRRVRNAAVVFVVLGASNAVMALSNVFGFLVVLGGLSQNEGIERDQLFGFGAVMAGLGLFGVVQAGLMIAAAVKLFRYTRRRLAMIAAIVGLPALSACLPFNLIGCVYVLVVLNREEVVLLLTGGNVEVHDEENQGRWDSEASFPAAPRLSADDSGGDSGVDSQ